MNDTCVFTSNEENNPCSNPQHDDMDFIRDDYYMQTGVADLMACLNEEFLCESVDKRAETSNIDMESGSILFNVFNEIDDQTFESSATHSDTPKGITADQLSKVWQV